MRVISGSARGHRLKGPPGPQTRPMADKIREALFSSLASLGIEPDRVLDLYAGTGSIGIEALSRGARHADFVDHQRAACATIRENLVRTRLDGRGTVHCMPIDRFLRHRGIDPYDFVALDPPYADPEIHNTLASLSESTLIQSGSIVILGHWPRLTVPDRIGRLVLLRHRCHGDSCFSIFEASDAPGDSESGDS
jgi:16S rRNA (guanine966-N2)-methyltransferase